MFFTPEQPPSFVFTPHTQARRARGGGEMAPALEPTSPGANSWSTAEDDKLQRALNKYSASVDNRWGKIAEEVGSRNKDQCKKRQKALELQLKKQQKSPKEGPKESPKGAGTPERAQEAVAAADTLAPAVAKPPAVAKLKALKKVGAEVDNRWDKIAKEVGTRNKDQCKKRQKQMNSPAK